MSQSPMLITLVTVLANPKVELLT